MLINWSLHHYWSAIQIEWYLHISGIYILRKVQCPPTWLWLHKADDRIGKLKLN